jgi:type II secretory pathway pseudopilin PulG
MINIKNGAMFGLDARISLAIFGALSVISGAALYSAIQEAKITQTISDLKENTKALEAFYLDVGGIPDLYSSNSYLAKSAQLVTDTNKNGWKGPYSSLKDHHGNNLRHPNGNDFHITYVKDSIDWDIPSSSVACDNTDPCFAWSRVYDHSNSYSTELKNAIDKKLDNSDGASKGSFRWNATSINLKGITVPNPN